MGRADDHAPAGPVHTRNHVEKRRLAGTVPPQDTDPFVGRDGQRRLIQHMLDTDVRIEVLRYTN